MRADRVCDDLTFIVCSKRLFALIKCGWWCNNALEESSPDFNVMCEWYVEEYVSIARSFQFMCSSFINIAGDCPAVVDRDEF